MTHKLGERLVKKGLITERQLREACDERQRSNKLLRSILIEQGLVTPTQWLEAMAEQYRMPCVQLRDAAIDRAVMEHVPLRVALHYHVMPIDIKNGGLTVAIANPEDVRLVDELRLALQQRYVINPVLATEEDILEAIRTSYGIGAETIQELLSDGVAAVKEDVVEDIEKLAVDASVVKLVNQLILEAHNRRATDIHLEPYRGKIKLRYRIDGMLHAVDVPQAIRQLFPAIVSRVKIISNLNLVERRLPQDGRASVKIGNEKLDLRIAVLPTTAGESVVIRILPNRLLVRWQELGFREEDLRLLERVIQKPHGLIFLTGPTGSGKTTTLYACLSTINTDDRKIVTIEDPVEYELEGISQVPINPKIGLTFANGLRSMLRHDPDVMMVGEVRDLETAELTIRIALTGHLVFSTLHTNDATSSVIRLLDMGIDPYLIASSIECVIAQRLIRLLCPHCKEEVTAAWARTKKVFRSRGCPKCHGTGYLGRRAIYEFFLSSPPIRELILARASGEAIRSKAVELGMRTMREDGEEKVQAGLTTMDEILRVTQDEG